MIVYLSFRFKQMKQVWRYVMESELWGNKNNNTQMLTKIFFSWTFKIKGGFFIFLNWEKWEWGGRSVAKALCVKAWKARVWILRTRWLSSECVGDRILRASWTAKLADGNSLGYVKRCCSSERSGDPRRKAPSQPWASTQAHTGFHTHVHTQHGKKKSENFGKVI